MMVVSKKPPVSLLKRFTYAALENVSIKVGQIDLKNFKEIKASTVDTAIVKTLSKIVRSKLKKGDQLHNDIEARLSSALEIVGDEYVKSIVQYFQQLCQR